MVEGRRVLSVVMALGLLVSGVASAQPAPEEPLVTDRPDVAEASETVGAGRFQLELGSSITSSQDSDGRRAVSLSTPLKLRFGVTRQLEFHLETAGLDQQWSEDGSGQMVSSSGFTSPDLGFKVHLLQGGTWLPSTGLLVALTLPGRDAVGQRQFVALSPTLALDWELPAALELGLNLGVTASLASKAADRQHLGRFALAVGRSWAPLTERLRTYVELFGQLPFEGDDNELCLDGGFAWLLSPNMQLDLTVAAGLTESAPDFGFGLGFSFRK